MKTILLLTILSIAIPVQAAETRPDPETKSGGSHSEYSVTERGAHHRVWERIETVSGPNGATEERIRRYTELTTGMHFQAGHDDAWIESKAEIQILPDGAGAGTVSGHG